MQTALVHATAIALRGQAVLLVGPPGSGKSDLALRLIDRGAILIADDQVCLTRAGDELLASPPESLAGLVEIRGIGIVPRPFARNVPVAMILDLAAPVERLPPLPGQWPRRTELGVAVPVLPLAPVEASAPLKVEAALALLLEGGGLDRG